jgi:hypothetical protein
LIRGTPNAAFIYPQGIRSTISAPIHTPHKRIAALQPVVKSAANLPLIIFLAMIDDASCRASRPSTASAAAIVNTPEPRSTLPSKQYPCRGVVPTYIGFSGEFASRNLFTVVFTLAS